MKAFTLLFFVACATSASAEPSADVEKEKAELLRNEKRDGRWVRVANVSTAEQLN